MVASLFRKVPDELFAARIKNVYLDIAKKWGHVPVEVANDGDVTALAGAMELGDRPVLGLAMGTSEAAGYVNRDGLIRGGSMSSPSLRSTTHPMRRWMWSGRVVPRTASDRCHRCPVGG